MATTTASAMAKRVLISAIAGVLAGSVLIVLVTVLFQRHVVHDGASLAMGLPSAICFWLAEATGLPIIGAIVASPLIAIAVVTGIVFRRSIDRHLLLWTSIAPVLAWLFTCAVFALSRGNIWREQHSYFDRLILEARGIDNSLFFFAPVAAAMCFAALTRRAARRGLHPALYAPPATR